MNKTFLYLVVLDPDSFDPILRVFSTEDGADHCLWEYYKDTHQFASREELGKAAADLEYGCIPGVGYITACRLED